MCELLQLCRFFRLFSQATAFSLDETSQGVGGGGLTPNAPNAVSRTGSMSMARIEESRIAELAMRMTELST
eukprot:5629393-Pleurochrysis_carterae.AAC.1